MLAVPGISGRYALIHASGNGLLEGLNSKIRLISHRAYGFHSATPLIAPIHLCCTDIKVALPR